MKTISSRNQCVFLLPLCVAVILVSTKFAIAAPGDAQYLHGQKQEQVIAQQKTKQGIDSRLAPELVALREEFREFQQRQVVTGEQEFESSIESLRVTANHILVDANATSNVSLLSAELLALGADNIATGGLIVSARLPLAMLDRLTLLSHLRFVRPSHAITHAGLTTTQGDVAQRSDIVRSQSGLDGSGVTIGALSDSFDCQGDAAADVASDDLSPVNVVEEAASCTFRTDEGRAMLQIVHDVAPGAGLSFNTAFGGQAGFANGITALVTAGADIVVDDVLYFAEPMFQDGIIAQSAEAAVAAGVAYFSSAGNSGSKSYQGPYVSSGLAGPTNAGTHDFDPGVGRSNLQQITVPVGAGFTVSFQWNQPFASLGGAGASTDLDIYVVGADSSTVLGAGTSNNLLSGDAVEVISFTNTGIDLDGIPGNDTTFYFLIENFAGPDPDLIKYNIYGSSVTIDTFSTSSGTAVGHANAAGVAALGAAFFVDTPEFGTDPPLLEAFSAAGNVPIYFDAAGQPLPQPSLRLTPSFTAPDGGNNTFFGNDSAQDADLFPNFFGTSAAAPHAAGVAALLLEQNPSLTPDDIYKALADSALDMELPGYDHLSGFGLIQADAALAALANTAPVLNPVPSQQGITGNELVFALTASDADGDNITITQSGMPGFCTLLDGGAGSGSITCPITAANNGTFPVSVTASDDGTPARSSSQGFYVVANANTAPVLDPIGNRQGSEGTNITVPLSASDADGDAISFAAEGLPGFCVLTDFNNGSASLDCSPTFDDAGTYPVSLLAVDDGTPSRTDAELVTLSVSDTNLSPVLEPIGNRSVNENQQIIIAMSATDSNISDTLGYSTSAMPGFCVLVDAGDGSGNISCAPTFADAGAYNFTVVVSDDGIPPLSDSEAITLTVNQVNVPPVLNLIGNRSIADNTVAVIPLSALDLDGDLLTLSQSGLPAFCALSDFGNGSGEISCAPLTSDIGSYPITVTVTDNSVGNLSDSESLQIVVSDINDINQPPTLSPIGDQSFDDDAPFVIPLAATDSDGDNLALSHIGLPPFCALTNGGNGTGNVTCIPLLGDAGLYAATIIVTDDGVPNLIDYEQINFDISHVNVPPIADAGTDQDVATQSLVILDGSNSIDPDSPSLLYAWRFASVAVASMLSDVDIVGATTTTPSFVPDVDGTYLLELTVTDDDLATATDEVAVNANTPSNLYFIDGSNPILSHRDKISGAEINAITITLAGETVDGGSALAVDTLTNQMYATLIIAGQSGHELVILDPDTGIATAIGDTGDVIAGLTFDAFGILYAVSDDAAAVPETLFTVDTTNGILSFLQTLGNGDLDDGIAYNFSNDTLYHTSGAITTIFESIELGSASTTNIPFSGDAPAEFRVLGIDYDPLQDLFLATRVDPAGLTYFSISPTGVTRDIVNLPVRAWRGLAFHDPSFQPAGVNTAPTLTAIADRAVAENDSIVIAVAASDADGDVLTFSASGLPAFCNLADAGDGSGSVSCSPGFDDAGNFNITVIVTDNGAPNLSASDGFTLTVSNTNRAPTLSTIGNQAVGEGSSVVIALAANDADGDALTLGASGLPVFCNLADAGDGSGSVSCSPGFGDAGSYAISVDVVDNGVPQLSANESFSLDVTNSNLSPQLTAIADQAVAENNSIVIALAANDADGNSLTFSASGLPTFCSLADAGDGSGSVSCSPGFDDAGSFNIIVSVTDNGVPPLATSDGFTLTVSDTNRAPTLSTIGNQAVAESDSIVIALAANDADGDALTFSASGLPTFCNLSDAGDGSGSVSCSPEFDDAGSFNIIVSVADNGVPPLAASDGFTLSVSNTNRAPTLSTIGNQAVAESDSIVIALAATDVDGNALAFSASGLPTFCALTDAGNGTGSVSCSPGFDDAGSFNITVSVADNGVPPLSASDGFTLTVSDTNRAPTLSAVGNQAVAENDSIVVALAANDADGDALAFSASGLPTFCTLTDAGDGTGSVSCSPGFDDAGNFNITAIVADDGTPILSASDGFTLNVTDTNRAPTLSTIGNQAVGEDSSVVIALTANDADGDALTFSASGAPPFCALTDAGNGSASLTCAPGFGDAGSYAISVDVVDNGVPQLSANEAFTLDVTDNNRSPQLTAIADQAVAESDSIVIALAATDADSDALTFSASALPLFCSLSDAGDGSGSVSCSPGFDDAGSFNITVTVADDGTPILSASDGFTLSVSNTNRAPSLNAIAGQSVAENDTLVIDLLASDPDGDNLALTQAGMPGFCNITDNSNGTGQIDCAPSQNDEGDYPIVVTATDDGVPGLADSQSFTLTINNVNIDPVADAGSDINVETGMPVNLDGSNSFDSDGDNLSFSWTVQSVPAGSLITDADIADFMTPMPSFTPDVDGLYIIELSVFDGLATDIDTVIVTATAAANVPPNADAGPDVMVVTLATVTLDGSASNDPDNGPNPLSYDWSFTSVPLGSVLTSTDLSDASGLAPFFTPDVDGAYVVSLQVSDGIDIDQDTIIVTAQTPNVPPTADAGVDQVTDLGLFVFLDGSASDDPDAGPAPISYSWSFASLPAISSLTNADILGASSATPIFIPDAEGMYLLRLDVTDGSDSDFDQVVIDVVDPGTALSVEVGVFPANLLIDPSSQASITIAVLTTSVVQGDAQDFDAAQIDTASVRFGRLSAVAIATFLQDIDGDGDLDSLFEFRISDIGITCGESRATLNGATYSGRMIIATAAISVVSCAPQVTTSGGSGGGSASILWLCLLLLLASCQYFGLSTRLNSLNIGDKRCSPENQCDGVGNSRHLD